MSIDPRPHRGESPSCKQLRFPRKPHTRTKLKSEAMVQGILSRVLCLLRRRGLMSREVRWGCHTTHTREPGNLLRSIGQTQQ